MIYPLKVVYHAFRCCLRSFRAVPAAGDRLSPGKSAGGGSARLDFREGGTVAGRRTHERAIHPARRAARGAAGGGAIRADGRKPRRCPRAGRKAGLAKPASARRPIAIEPVPAAIISERTRPNRGKMTDRDRKEPRMPDSGNLQSGQASRAGAIQVAGLDHLVLRVADLDRAIKFYGEVLGCHVERRLDEPKLVQLRAGTSMIDLVPAGCSAAIGGGGGRAQPRPFRGAHRHLRFPGVGGASATARDRGRRGPAALWRRGLRLFALHHRPRRQRRRAQGSAGTSSVTRSTRDPVGTEETVACWIASS